MIVLFLAFSIPLDRLYLNARKPEDDSSQTQPENEMTVNIMNRIEAAWGKDSEEYAAVQRLVAAATQVVSEDGGMDRYDHDEDEVGSRSCCGVVSYDPHEADCWVVQCRTALIPFQTQ